MNLSNTVWKGGEEGGLKEYNGRGELLQCTPYTFMKCS
jgi:hypothetical protein